MPERQPLIPPEIAAHVPPLYSNENKAIDDVIVVVKLYNPYGAGTWYVTEYDPAERIAFGYATYGDLDDPCAEWGCISLDELEQAPAFILGRSYPEIQGVERDEHFSPKTWREVKAEWHRAMAKADEATGSDEESRVAIAAFEED